MAAALAARKQNSPWSLAYAAATIAVETDGTFAPIREYGEIADLTKRYGYYYGRGFIQTTWLFNYERVREAIGVDVVARPDLLLQPHLAALAFALYWSDHRIGQKADEAELYPAKSAGRLIVHQAIRRRVNGGLTGFKRFYDALVVLGCA